jgi:aminoglycoside phosphotransferase (APT) family kinase protein
VTGSPDPAEPTLDAPGTPPAEHDIDESLVRRLLSEQHPDLARLELQSIASGWDNSTWRLGGDLAVRLPRREASSALVRHEQTWLPVFAERISLPIPVPVRVGEPSGDYPWPWSVVRWVPGVAADREPLDSAEAASFGRFLAQVHTPAPPEAPANPYRGVPLEARADGFAQRLERLSGLDTGLDPRVTLTRVREIFERGMQAPLEHDALWLHGDLHPKNVLCDAGRLAGVVDWGDLTGGDPASDLASAWMLFPTAAHDALWASYSRLSPALWTRARAWAAVFGVIFLDTGLANDPSFKAVGTTTLGRVCEAVTSPC